MDESLYTTVYAAVISYPCSFLDCNLAISLSKRRPLWKPMSQDNTSFVPLGASNLPPHKRTVGRIYIRNLYEVHLKSFFSRKSKYCQHPSRIRRNRSGSHAIIFLICEMESMDVCLLAEQRLSSPYIIYDVNKKSCYVFFDSQLYNLMRPLAS